MLEYVIKRNGTREVADASKINGWMEALSKDIKDRLDWSSVVMEVFRESPEVMATQDLQLALSKKFVSKHTWVSSLMGGRLYGIWHWKNLYGDKIPTLKEQHKQMVSLGLMEDLGYTDKEYDDLEEVIDHQRDLRQAQFQLKQNIYKYGLANRVLNKQMETPQFIYMRMAMALCQKEDKETKLKSVKDFYDYLSFSKINAPTPNFTNLGTPHRGYASCCLIMANDTAASLAAADHAAYVMTYMSAGIGRFINTRSEGDSVRGGFIEHQGKMPYFEAGGSATKANLQGGRGGADTEYVQIFDPEIKTIVMAQNPRTPVKKQNRKVHFNIMYNSFFVKKAALKEQIFTFNCFTAPDLFEALFSPNLDEFEALYLKYEQDEKFTKNYIDAWELAVMVETQSHEVSTLYTFDIQRANVNTPFRKPVRQSNLCGEIVNMTQGYPSAEWLYKENHRNGEIGVCNIGGIVIPNIANDEEYFKACYLELKMIDTTIDLAHYELPHVGYMAKRRRNAAIGAVGVAEVYAKKGVRFDTPYGLELAHQMAERHLYFVVKAAIKLTEERGLCEFADETKWGDGWLPFDNYKKNLDSIVAHKLKYDWEPIRQRLRELGGLHFSTLIAHMPTESSSKAAGKPNGIYPIRELYMKKSDMNAVLDWVAPDDDLYGSDYQVAFDIETVDLTKYYAVWQKFCDQTISADYYEDRVRRPVLTEKYLVNNLVARARYGVVTKYYQNAVTVNPDNLDKENNSEQLFEPSSLQPNARGECSSGACTL